MITDTMSYADIAKELEEDYKNVVRYQVHLPVKKYMKEVMSRPDGKVLFKPVEWTSPRHNKMLLTPFSRNKKDARKNGLVVNVCCIFLYKGELNMAVYSHMVLPWIHVQLLNRFLRLWSIQSSAWKALRYFPMVVPSLKLSTTIRMYCIILLSLLTCCIPSSC